MRRSNYSHSTLYNLQKSDYSNNYKSSTQLLRSSFFPIYYLLNFVTEFECRIHVYARNVEFEIPLNCSLK